MEESLLNFYNLTNSFLGPDIFKFIENNIFGNYYIQKSTFTILVFIAYFIIRVFLNRGIDMLFVKVREKIVRKQVLAKTMTLRSLLKNTVDIIVFLVAVLTILSNIGVNIGPLLTGAGILGLAVSFGSQSLVKDVISGFFIIWEDQFNVGDSVKIAGYEGEVSKITLRTTILRDRDGNKVFIPNSAISSVVRYQKMKKVKIYTSS